MLLVREAGAVTRAPLAGRGWRAPKARAGGGGFSTVSLRRAPVARSLRSRALPASGRGDGACRSSGGWTQQRLNATAAGRNSSIPCGGVAEQHVDGLHLGIAQELVDALLAAEPRVLQAA